MKTEPTEKDILEFLKRLAEDAVSIPKGQKVGRWTREDRVALVYSALCAIYRIRKRKQKTK